MLINSKLFAESWNVAWREKQTGSLLEDNRTEFKIIKNSLRYWAADPFVIEYQEETYIFAELYDYVRRRGVLGYCTIKEQKWIPIIIEDFHLSYPYIFKIGQDIFLMPESNESKELYIYKATDFPRKWEKKVHSLRKNVNYADTTPFSWEDKKYAMTYDVSDPFHPQLVLLDFQNEENDRIIPCDIVDQKRPAGKFFTKEEKHYRPAQDCKGGYGKGLIFYQYSLERDQYQEISIKHIKTEDIQLSQKLYKDGIHTYNSNNQYEVIDIKTRRINLINIFFRIIGKFMR